MIKIFDTNFIVSRTPFRITLGGGGTDLPFFYEKEGGFLISASIKKYMYVLVSKRVHRDLLLSYSKSEMCSSLDDIQHPVIKECLKISNLADHLAILSYADIPAKSGLGSSGSFTVGLLNAINAYQNKYVRNEELAELACHIQMNILNEPSGKQDEYIAAFGGLTCFDISKTGKVTSTPLKISNSTKQQLENNLLFFDTGILRSASEVLTDQKVVFETEPEKIEYLRKIKDIGYRSKEVLESGHLDEFGYLLDEHWLQKKKTSKKISNNEIDKRYELAKTLGALGGKLIGAGGGGFLMFYANTDSSKTNIRKKFSSLGMNEMKFPFESKGTKIILDLSEGVQ